MLRSYAAASHCFPSRHAEKIPHSSLLCFYARVRKYGRSRSRKADSAETFSRYECKARTVVGGRGEAWGVKPVFKLLAVMPRGRIRIPNTATHRCERTWPPPPCVTLWARTSMLEQNRPMTAKSVALGHRVDFTKLRRRGRTARGSWSTVRERRDVYHR